MEQKPEQIDHRIRFGRMNEICKYILWDKFWIIQLPCELTELAIRLFARAASWIYVMKIFLVWLRELAFNSCAQPVNIFFLIVSYTIGFKTFLKQTG